MTNPLQISALTTRKPLVLYFDAGLLVVFVLLLSPRLTGLAWHEVLGLLFVLPVLFHILIAQRWIVLAVKRLVGFADRRARVNFGLNATLFVLMVIEIFSGVEISQLALPYLGLKTINDESWRLLHNLTLNWTLLLVGLHIAMNWTWIATAIRRRIADKSGRVVVAVTFWAALRWIALVLMASAIIAVVSLLILGKPAEARLHVGDEVSRFSANLQRGAVQFLGESCLVAVVAYLGRRWLRVRL
jgi:hypothetical protein